MSARTTSFSAMALWLCARVASGAEDHSQHRDEPRALDEHTEHHHHAPDTSTEAQSDPHTEHRQAVDQQGGQPHDDHVQHAAPSEPTESERAHIPPEPPQHVMDDMSPERMIELMQMEDDAPVGMVLLDQFEWREDGRAETESWELQAWYGNDYNKLWLKTEGERVDREAEGRTDLLWNRIISPWWSAQAGARQDFGDGPSRTWAAAGVQGLAPYFFEVEATVYVGEGGRTAARFSGEYDLLFTQRLILQPDVEVELFGKDDPKNGIGAGFSSVEIGLRLRYEIRREIAPYVGVHWERKFGTTADYAYIDGQDTDDVMFVAGLRAWF